MQTITLNIGGMTCGGCVNSVKRVLTESAGVSDVDVRLETHSATVRFDADKTSIDALKAAIEDAGFTATTA